MKIESLIYKSLYMYKNPEFLVHKGVTHIVAIIGFSLGASGSHGHVNHGNHLQTQELSHYFYIYCTYSTIRFVNCF